MDKKLQAALERIAEETINGGHIFELVDTYYQCVIMKIDEHDNEDEPDDQPFPDELYQPLEQRDSGIFEALSILLKQGHDVNDEADGINSLMLSVANADVHMTKYLIEHGANPNNCPDMDNESLYPKSENYYLEDIDLKYTDACFGNDERYKESLLQTAQVLVEGGGLKSFGGLCLLVDSSGNVSLELPKKKY